MENYKGTWKKPKNFDKYWLEKINSLNNLELEYKLIKKEFSIFEKVEYYDLYFYSFDGAKIYAKYIKPKTDSKVPILFYFHGYPASSRNWLEKTSFASLGYAVLAIDCRGQGGKSEDIGAVKGATVFGHLTVGLDDSLDNMLYVKNIMDICLLVRIAKKLEGINTDNFVTYGASQGGGLSIMCAALNPEVKKCISLYPFLSDYKKVYDIDKDNTAYQELRLYSRWYNNDEKRNEEIFEKLAYIDAKNFAPLVKASTLFGISGLDKECPLESQYAVFNNLNCSKTLYFYKKYGHETIPDFNNRVLDFLLENENEFRL